MTNLAQHLGSWSADDLSFLMETRPDLLSASDRGIDAVARKAGTAMSLGRALVAADVGMLVVADALVARHPATIDDIDRLLGTNDRDGVLDAVERLRRRGIVVVDDGVIFPVGSLGDLLHRPLGLGPSFVELAEHLSSGTIDRLAAETRAEGADRRSATVRAIAHRLTQPEVVAALLATAPEASRQLLAALVAKRSPAVPLPTGYPYRVLDADDPLAWLIDRGLVVAVTETGAELPRELVIAGLTDGLAPAATLRKVELQPVEGLAADLVAGATSDRANRLLDGAETLLRLVGNGEVTVRKVGGVGPRELRRLAKASRLDVVDVARLLELLSVARLIRIADRRLETSDLAGRWWTMSRRRRYLALVRAWVAAERFLSRGLAGTRGDGTSDTSVVALGDAEPVAAAEAGRAVALETICTLSPDAAFQPSQLAASVVWQGPNLWGAGEPPPELLVAWTLAEAELLGLISTNAPGPVLRALVDGDEAALERATATALADDQERFVLQADLTALAFGPLAPSVGRQLGEMTERAGGAEQGRAPSFRFTEASIRRAYDSGWTAESITAFLDEHALAGVPQPLEYLLNDVARRYGSIRVMPAQAVIVTDDDITAVEIASNRRTAGLALRLVAPTVLTSPLDPVTVTEALRSLGLFPVLDGSSIVLDTPRALVGDQSAAEKSAGDGATDLPADWIGPPLPAGPFPDEVDDAVSALLDTPQPEIEPVVDDQPLQAFWGRPVVVDAVVEQEPVQLVGTVVGLGRTVSLLTTAGVIEIPTESVVAHADPDRG